ncbi:DUF6232 family protein [Actinokineospora terrae]|uniref:Uncharacterized protein n=1 Tax=Actinokineospora terrae TaxID=155974 RepID=A0A1H9WZB5_9PSEU|nr:DUF6232 family protein [Actinokineospora terrae]SES39250.1 hypothetical protein SAMN04487818_11247 [Actinokineospora terrae]
MATGEIRIANGILWIGSEAYPLRNISHVGSRWIDPQPIKRKAVKDFVVRTLICLVVAGVVATASTPAAVLVALGGLALLIWRLSVALGLRPIYGLVLNTAGVQQDAIWSYEEDEIMKLIAATTEAIGNPDTAPRILNVHNVVAGDVIQQYGSDNTGKQVNVGAGR